MLISRISGCKDKSFLLNDKALSGSYSKKIRKKLLYRYKVLNLILYLPL